jgi:lysozyme
MRKTNAAGIKLIKEFEGLRLEAYKDIVGVWTIGFGHTKNVKPLQKITEQEAEQLLKEDLSRFEKYVNKPEWAWLNENQFSALVSLAFNVGSFQTGLKGALITREPNRVTERMVLYNKANGQVVPGLVRRRQAEIELFNTPVRKTSKTFLATALSLFGILSFAK